MSLEDRWSTFLDDLRATGRYRQLTGPQGVDFASNDYLGYGAGRRTPAPLTTHHSPLTTHHSPLTTHHSPLTTHHSPRSNQQSGMASRLLHGHQLIWDEVEAALARWHGAEAALIMTSGYVANEGLLSTIVEARDWVASDELNHASIIDGLRLARPERFVYRHNNLDHLESGLRLAAQKRVRGQELFVVTESLFGMDGDLAALPGIVQVALRYGAHVIVDEAHSTGCFGPTGSGCVDAAGLRQQVLATVHTGGKALGVAGAYICAGARLRELLINRCRHFIFTTALPPTLAAWWLDALVRVQKDHAGRSALHAKSATFRAELTRNGITTPAAHYIIPVILGDDARAVRAAQRLRDAGWDIRAIRPPSVPVATARLRISIHADHESDTLVAAARAVAERVSCGEW